MITFDGERYVHRRCYYCREPDPILRHRMHAGDESAPAFAVLVCPRCDGQPVTVDEARAVIASTLCEMFLDKPVEREPGDDDDDDAEIVTIGDFLNGVRLGVFSVDDGDDDEGEVFPPPGRPLPGFGEILETAIGFAAMLRDRNAARVDELGPLATDADRAVVALYDEHVLRLEWMREAPMTTTTPTTTTAKLARLLDSIRINGLRIEKRACKLCGRTIWIVPLATKRNPRGAPHPVTDDGESHFNNCPNRAKAKG